MQPLLVLFLEAYVGGAVGPVSKTGLWQADLAIAGDAGTPERLGVVKVHLHRAGERVSLLGVLSAGVLEKVSEDQDEAEDE